MELTFEFLSPFGGNLPSWLGAGEGLKRLGAEHECGVLVEPYIFVHALTTVHSHVHSRVHVSLHQSTG